MTRRSRPYGTQWGLDRPLPLQYAVYMRNLVTGDLGQSLRYRTPVIDLLPRRTGVTLFLVVYSTLLSLVIAVPLAIVAATHRDRWPDQLVRGLITIPLASPVFWIGILLLILFALTLGWFPASGYGEGFVGHLRHLFLPALTLSGFFTAVAHPESPLGADRRADDGVRRLRPREGARPAHACCSATSCARRSCRSSR